jgi:hypothetical protein
MIISKRSGMIFFGYIFITFGCLLIVLMINDIFTYEHWITTIAVVTLLHGLSSIVLLSRLNMKIYRLPVLFLICMYIFNLGQVWLLGLFKSYKFYKQWNKIQIYPEYIYKKTCLIIFVVTAFYVLGVMIGILLKEKNELTHHKNYQYNLFDAKTNAINYDFRIIGWIILIITLPFNLYENIQYIKISMISGYKEIFNLSIADYVNVLGWISVVGFVLLMLFSALREKKVILFFSIALYGIEMISGNRGPSVCAILTILSFYFISEKNKKLNFGKTILLCIFIFVNLIFLSTLKTFRGYSEKNISSFFACVKLIMENNIIFQNLEEFGGTVAVTSIVQKYLEETQGFLHGWTYIAGVFSIFPNIGDVVSKITNSGSLVYLVAQHGIYGRYQSIGGSIIAELYLNFQYTWWLAAMVLGFIVNKIDTHIESSLDSINIAYWIMPFFTIIHWTRSNYNSMVRMVVWSWILIYVIKKIVIRNR